MAADQPVDHTIPGETIRVRSSLRLFLSLDVVGSTEFKQPRTDREPAHDDSWVRPFLTFYRMSIDQMAGQWKRVVSEMKAVETGDTGRFVFGEPPAFWKGAGDEVLFSKRVVSPLDAIAAVHSLVGVMKAHRRQFATKPQTKLLNVKGAAWLAGFPLNNAEIVIATDGAAQRDGRLDDELSENYRLLSLLDAAPELRDAFKADYIGPSIDLGFRLREHASARQFVVSADLIWLMCQAHERSSPVEHAACPLLDLPKIGYAGRLPLKGILADEPYPVFWIEDEPGTALDDAEDRLLDRHPHSDGRAVAAFCETFLDDSNPLRMRPYIEGSTEGEIGVIAADRLEKVRRLEAYVNGEAGQLASLAEDDSAATSDTMSSEAESFADTPPDPRPAPSPLPAPSLR